MSNDNQRAFEGPRSDAYPADMGAVTKDVSPTASVPRDESPSRIKENLATTSVVYQQVRSSTSTRVSHSLGGEGARSSLSPSSPQSDGGTDPFTPNKELYNAFVGSTSDNHTKAMAERLMKQLSALSQKVGALTASLNQQKQVNADLQFKLSQTQTQSKPEEDTLLRFLSAIKESSVHLAYQLDGSTRFPLAGDVRYESMISTISAAMEVCAKSVSTCRQSMILALGSEGADEAGSLAAQLEQLARRGPSSPSRDSATGSSSDRLVLSRVIDILGGDATRYSTMDELRQAAPSAATKARASMEQTIRDSNAASVALKEYERRAQQMLKACGVTVVPSSQELLDNGGVGGRSSYDKGMESAQWLSKMIASAENRQGVAQSSGSLQERLAELLRKSSEPSSLELAIRKEVIPLLPQSIPQDAPHQQVVEALVIAINDSSVSARQSPRRQASILGVEGEQTDVLLGELVDELDSMATESSEGWSALGRQLAISVPAAVAPATSTKARRSVTHGDLSRAIARLKERLALVADATLTRKSPQDFGGLENTSKPSDQRTHNDAEAANDRALYALAQLIPKTTISGAVPTQNRAKSGSSMNTTVVPSTDNLDEMVTLVAERIEVLHQSLQKSYRQSDTHRSERIRLEELLHVKAPVIAKTLFHCLQSIRNANAEEDTDNAGLEAFMPDGQLMDYPLDSMDAAHNFANFFEPILEDIAARAEALKTKCSRISSNHRTDRQRIANYAASQAATTKRWHKTVSEVINVARFLGVDCTELSRSLGEDAVDAVLAPNSISTSMCPEVLKAIASKVKASTDPQAVDAAAIQTELLDLREQADSNATQRQLFAQTIAVVLQKLAEIGRSLKRCMYAFGPDDTDYDEVMEGVLASDREATVDEDEEALGTVIKKLTKWSARLDVVSTEHTRSLQKSVRYFNGVHATICNSEVEIHDANALDADDTLIRIADGILMSLSEKPRDREGWQSHNRVPHETTPDGEGRYLGSDQDHRLIRIHSVVTKQHMAMDALLKVQYLAIPGLMDEDSDRTSDSSPSRAQTAFLDIDPETTALTTTELVRLIEQNLRNVDGCLARFSVGHKQAAIYVQKDMDSLQADLANMLGQLSQFDVQESFGINRGDLKGLYDVLKDRAGQRGNYFFNRLENGEGQAPWVTALGFLCQTYGPTLEMLASKAESQRWFKKIVDKSMDEAADYIQWCRDQDVPLPAAIARNTVNGDEIELTDEHLPVVINYASTNAKGARVAEAAQRQIGSLQRDMEELRRDASAKRAEATEVIEGLRRQVVELSVQKDSLASEAALARAQLRRLEQQQEQPPPTSYYHQRQPAPQATIQQHYDYEHERDVPPPHYKQTQPAINRAPTPTRLPSEGYSARHKAKAGSPSRHRSSTNDDDMVASHPTVKEYVRALCNEIEQRHRTSPPRARAPTPTKRTSPARPPSKDVLGPHSYQAAQRSEHHRQPIASPNTCLTTHSKSPDRHCRTAHTHTHGTRSVSPLQRHASRERNPVRHPFVVPRSVMIIGPLEDNNGTSPPSVRSSSVASTQESRQAYTRVSHKHITRVHEEGQSSRRVSPVSADVVDRNLNTSKASNGSGRVVHVKNSEIALVAPRRSVDRRSGSAGKWRI